MTCTASGRLLALLVSLAVLGVACAAKKAATAPAAPPPSVAQPVPAPPPPASPSPASPQPAAAPPAKQGPAGAVTPPARPQTPPLTGQVKRADLEAFPGWEQLRAQDYVPDPSAVASLKAALPDVEALLFVASWCPDSRREVPRLFKILDQAGFPESRVTMHALDRTKKDAGGLTVKWNIERVPTFIFLRDGKEIGRVIERPAGVLEQDILKIVGPRT